MRWLWVFLVFAPCAHADFLEGCLASWTKETRYEFASYHWSNRGLLQDGTKRLKFGIDEAVILARVDETGKKSEFVPVETSAPEALTYFKALSGNHGPNANSWVLGGALYTASDPLQSASFAGTPWALIKITTPAGTRYFDEFAGAFCKVSKKLIQTLANRAGGDQSAKNFFMMTHCRNEQCGVQLRDLIRQSDFSNRIYAFAKANQVAFIRYRWDFSRYSHCPSGNAAFAFIDPTLAERGLKTEVYVQEAGVNSVDDQLYRNMISLMLGSDEILGTSEKNSTLSKFRLFFERTHSPISSWPEAEVQAALQRFKTESFGCVEQVLNR